MGDAERKLKEARRLHRYDAAPRSSRTVLITGSTDGVGKLVAYRLAAAGDTVLLHGRSRAKGEAVLAEINAATANDRLEYYRADFASLDDVRRLAQSVQRRHDRLHVLINNAGVGSGPRGAQREVSRDGYELRFAVNYLAPFLLSHLLLPILLPSAPARIVNVSSIGQHPIDFADPLLKDGYDGQRAYRQSKLAQVMFTFELAERLRGTGITVNCLHPATLMDTKMVREGWGAPMSTVEEGAAAILFLATAPETTIGTGRFYDGNRVARANPQAYDAAARRRLWELSLRLTNLSPAALRRAAGGLP
jgi:NAD(P)-dependent dehydrogenase (short-subunit alcohol dehydrogenase family)